MIPGGAIANREFLEGKWAKEQEIDPNLEAVLFDPQTSGGLFMAIPEQDAEGFEQDALSSGIEIALIGEVIPRAETLIFIK